VSEDPRLRRWLEALVATPGLTAVRNARDAWRIHVEEALAGLPLLGDGPLVDVGSGGGSPGLPLAGARPDLEVTLLEANRRKAAFLAEHASAFPNVRVVCARAEEWARGEGRDAYGVATARALAPQPVALEWCLPLVRPGGVLLLWAGAPIPGLEAAAAILGGAGPEAVRVPGAETRHLLRFRKLAQTPERFPRRAAATRKRPLIPLDSNG
jgi:16S rRNA (guanine527-N7)-methyltransferase